jgi:hypothetical protein
MATEEPQTSSVVRVPAEPEIAGAQVIGQEALAELVDQVVLVGLAVRVALVALANRVALVALANRVALANPVASVALANRGELAGLVVKVVALELNRVVAPELEIAQVAVLETKHLAAQAAVVLRTKSVTAAHPRGLVPVRAAEEDLAAAVETTREPAAAEVGTAWAAVE